ncbi:MAG: prolyl oligopeptidase family serine peptidase [Gemmatimonadaceae bacterium]
MIRRSPLLATALLLAAALLSPCSPAVARAQAPGANGPTKQLSIADMRAWKSIRGPSVSPDGKWLAYQLAPNDGDASVVIRSTTGETSWTFPVGDASSGGRGGRGGASGAVTISGDSKWAMFSVAPTKAAAEQARKSHKPAESKVALVDLATGHEREFARIGRFAFAGDHPQWVALHTQVESGGVGAEAGGRGGSAAPTPRAPSSDLLLYRLADGMMVNIGNVGEFGFDHDGQYLAYTVETSDRVGDGIQLRNLGTDVVRTVDGARAAYRQLAWADSGLALAALRVTADSATRDTTVAVVAFNDFGAEGPKKTVLELHGRSDAPEGMAISPDRGPTWSEDLGVVYFGLREAPTPPPKDSGRGTDLQSLIKPGAPGMGGTVNQPKTPAVSDEDLPSLILWHWNDPRLQSQQIVQEQQDKRYSYLAEYRLGENRVIRLANDSLRDVSIAPHDRYAYALGNRPYERDESITGRAYVDIYTIDLRTGAEQRPVRKVITRVVPSADGSHLLYWGMDANWHLIDMATGAERNLTKGMPVTFANLEDDHYNLVQPPEPVVGWSRDGASVLLSDGWDVWKVSAGGAPAVDLTRDGRTTKVRYQRRTLVPLREKGIDLSKPLYFQTYGEWTKQEGLSRVNAEQGGATRLMWDDAALDFMKARDADVVVYSRGTFNDYPDLYLAKSDLSGGTRLTDADPQQQEFAWSSGTRLINYTSAKGDKLQGALFLPANYQPGKKYPLLVEIYEKRSQELHDYVVPNDTRAPDLSVYTSRGYAVLLPDIVYRVNDPGMSAVWCVVPAVQAAIATGIVDPAHVGLHGHSWGGYQTAFLVTQTHIFAAAVAGAPLTDMVSMYGSVYWNAGIGDAQIFESSQGRFKGSFLDNWDAYVRNSPAFHSKNVTTPLIVLSDDKDGAVDFNQGITWYNDLRNAGKKVILLTYVGENHGLAKPVNQRDYAMRMQQFFDHYLKGTPAPDWMVNGIPRLKMEAVLKAERARVDAELPKPPADDSTRGRRHRTP